EVCADAVGGQIGRRMLGRDPPQRCQRAAGRVDATALDGRGTTMADIQDVPVRARCEDRRRAGGRRLAAGHELAGAGVDPEAHDLVVFLQAHVQHVPHVVPPTQMSSRSHGFGCYFAAPGNAGSLPMSRMSCWITTVALRFVTICFMRSIEATVAARSKLKLGTPPLS